MSKYLVNSKKSSTFALAFVKKEGAIAQLVEQRTENPCVPGSIPGGTTRKDFGFPKSFLFFISSLHLSILKSLFAKSDFNEFIL